MKNVIERTRKREGAKGIIRGQNGITLIILVITIILLAILTFTIMVNFKPYSNEKRRAAFESDARALKEEIDQYYARYGELPIAKDGNENDIKYDSSNIPFVVKDDWNVININDDTDEYYVIDTDLLDVDLNLSGTFIVNKQSHTVYYPEGVVYADGVDEDYEENKVHYRVAEVFTEVSGNQSDRIAPIIDLFESRFITTKSFNVNAIAEDAGSGLDKIIYHYRKEDEVTFRTREYKLDKEKQGTTEEVRNDEDYDNLTTGYYIIYIEAYDVAGNKTISEQKRVKLEEIDEIQGETSVAKDPDDWTNGNVTVTLPTASVQFIEGTDGYEYKKDFITEYKIGDSGEWSTYNPEHPVVVERNTTIQYRYTDGTNSATEEKTKSVEITNIDKVPPTVDVNPSTPAIDSANDVIYGENISVKVRDLQDIAKLYGASGVKQWQINQNATEPDNDESKWSTLTKEQTTSSTTSEGHIIDIVKKATPSTYKDVGTYYIWAKDQAGNINEEIKDGVNVLIAKIVINPKSTEDFTVTLGDYDKKYNGEEKTPSVTIKDGDRDLVQGKDYTLEYKDNKDAGTATVTVKYSENYTGTKVISFPIEKRELIITADTKSKKYGEQDPEFTYTVTDGTVTGQTPKFEGTLSREEGENAGTYKITKGSLELVDNGTFLEKNYTIKIADVNFTIEKADGFVTLDENKAIEYETASTTFEIKKNHGGTLTVEDDNETATVAVSGTTVTVSNLGTLPTKTKVTITVKCAETINYKEATATFILSITGKVIPIPQNSATLVYNAKEQEPTWTNYNTEYMTIGGVQKGTNAGEYEAIFTLKDPESTEWSDGTSEPKKIKWTIGQYDLSSTATIAAPENQQYTGSEIKPETAVTVPLPAGSTTTLVKGTDFEFGYSNNTNAGTATMSVIGKGNYKGTKSIDFVITKKEISVPTQKETLTYNGKEQTPTWNNYDDSIITIGGDQKGTNAGDYTATFTLKDPSNTKWADGTQTPAHNATWTIEKQQVNAPTNVQVSTAGIVTWNNSNNATGYQISLDGEHWEDATSGIDYLAKITATTGDKTVYVRAINSDTNNYTSPSANVTATVTVVAVTITSNDTNKGTVDTASYNVIKGATFVSSENTLTIKGVTTATTTIDLKTVTGTAKTGYHFENWTPANGTVNEASTITATFAPNTDTKYVVNHYTHDLGANTYTLNSSENKTGTTDATLTLADLKKTIAGFTYVDGYLTGDTTKPTSGAVNTTTIAPDGTRIINLYYRRNYLYVQYDMNGGSAGNMSDTRYGVSGTLATYTGNSEPTKFWVGVYGSTVNNLRNDLTYVGSSNGLHNYNNSSYINIVRAGYVAKSGEQWNTKTDGTGTGYSQDKNDYSANNFGGVDLSTGDQTVTLYVNWTTVNYTITYNGMDGATNGTGNPTNYNVETNTITLADPSKEGYTFTGWTTEGVTTPTKNLTIPKGSTGNKTFTANWKINQYEVKCEDWLVDAEDARKVKIRDAETKQYDYGTTVNGNEWGTEAISGGYTFHSSTTAVVKADNSTVVYRHWYKHIDLNYYVDGTAYYSGYPAHEDRIQVGIKTSGEDKGYKKDYNQDIPYGETWEIYGVKLDNVEVSTYKQNGTIDTTNPLNLYFYTLSATVNNAEYGSIQPTELIVWKDETYTTSGNTLTMSDGRTITATPTNITGYTTTVSSWTPASGKISEKTTVTANFTRTANKYTVTVDANGGTISTTATEAGWDVATGGAKATKEVTYDSPYGDLPEPTRTGYTFTGWKNGDKDVTKDTTVSTASNHTLTAQWEVTTYTIVYDYAEGTKGAKAPTSATYDVDVEITNPTKAGYTFSGWTSTSADGLGSNAKTGTAANPETNWNGAATTNTFFKNLRDTNGTVKLTATWTGINYKVVFHKNDGTTTTSEQTGFIYGTPKALNANTWTRTGYTFKGWSTTANGTTAEYADKANMTTGTTTANGTADLYAVWKDETGPVITVTNSNGATDFITKVGNFNASNNKSTGTITAIVSATDSGSGMTGGKIEYVLDKQNTANPTTGWTETTSGATISLKNVEFGTYYLHVKATDKDGNVTYVTTKELTVRYRITYYDYEGATAETQVATPKTPTITTRTPEARAGYTFDGWYTAANGGTKVVDENVSYTPTMSRVVYGHWLKAATNLTMELSETTYVYDGTAKMPEVIVKDGDVTLVKDVDYTVTYKNNTNAGTATVTVTMKNTYNSETKAYYTGSKDLNFTITRKPITFPAAVTKEYTGSEQTLFEAHTTGEYTNTVLKGTNVGEYKVVLTPTANYQWSDGSNTTAARELTCTIAKQKVKAPTNVQVSTAGIVTWNASSNATGYEISTNPTTGFVSAQSGVDYLSTLNTSAGEKTIYVRAVNSDTVNYTTPSDNASKAVTVLTVTVNSESTTKGTVDTASYNVISGATYTTSGNKLTFKGVTTGTTTKDLKTVIATPKTGYSFASWSSANGTVTTATTITARFTANNYTIKFNSNGGTGTMANEAMTYDVEKALTKNTFTRTGYEFAGWATTESGTKEYNDEQKVKNLTATNNKTVNLYAKWTANKYTVTVDANGGTIPTTATEAGWNVATGGASATKEVTYDSTYGDLPEPTKTGYTFTGWKNGDADVTKDTKVTTASDHTLTAQWQINQYKLTYDYQDSYTYQGEGTLDTGYKVDWSKNFKIEAKFIAPTAGQRYAVFSNYNSATQSLSLELNTSNRLRVWMGTGGNTDYVDTLSSTAVQAGEEITAVYEWNATTKVYTLTATGTTTNITMTREVSAMTGIASKVFLLGRDTRKTTFGPMTIKSFKITEILDYNTVVSTLPTATKVGYTYNGWYTSATGGTKVTSVTIPASDTTIYAQCVVKKYTVTYNYAENGGTSATKTTATVAYDSAIDLTPTATKSGWTFVGWNTNKDATSKLTSLTMEDADVTLYAIYSKTLTGTFHYYKNQSTTASVTIWNKATNGQITAPAALGEADDYTFRHWSESNAADGASAVAASGKATISANKDYYASYQKTITGTFYYCTVANNSVVSTNGTQSSKTTTATQYRGYTGTVKDTNFTVPPEVTSSVGGSSGQNYIGVATAENNATVVTPTTANTTFYAVYTEDLTFYFYNGSTHTNKKVTRRVLSNNGKYVSSISEVEPTPSAYDGAAFSHWSYDATKYTDDYKRTPTATGVNLLYAVYKKTISATFNYYDGSKAASKTASNTRYYVSKSGGVNTYNTDIAIPDEAKANTTISSVTYTYRGIATANTANATVLTSTPTTATVNGVYYTSYTYPITIKYDGNNSTSGTKPANQTGTAYMNYQGTKVGVSITTAANPFTRTGYTFSKWNTKADGTGTDYNASTAYQFTASETLYAKWTPNVLTINVYANGAEKESGNDLSSDLLLSNKKYNYDATDFASAGLWNYDKKGTWALTKVGHTATKYWHIGSPTSTTRVHQDTKFATTQALAEAMGLLSELQNGNVTVNIYAGWSVNQYTATFDSNGGTTTANPQKITRDYGTKLGGTNDNLLTNSTELPPNHAGADAVDNVRMTKELVTESASPSGKAVKITRTAAGTDQSGYYYGLDRLAEGQTYTITFKAKGSGTWRVGHEQGGSWSITPTSTYQEYTKTFTASASAYKAIIFYEASKANGAYIQFQPVTITCTMPTTYKTGYTFDGWYTAATGGDKITENSTMPAENPTYYAHWTAANYTIKYWQGNNSTTAGSTQFSGTTTATYDQDVKLQKYAGTPPTGWTFAGWTTSQTGTTVIHTDEKTVKNLTGTPNGTVNLYAIFKRNVTFKSGVNGTATNEEQRYTPYRTTGYITAVTAPKMTAIDNWLALGYREDTTAGEATLTASTTATAKVTPAYDATALTYYGVYSRNYTATFYSGISKATTSKTKDSEIAYYNSSAATLPTKVSITLMSAGDSTNITNWTERGWRIDTQDKDRAYTYGATAEVEFGTNFYSVYRRSYTATFYSGVNKATTDKTKASSTVYYNTNTATLPTTVSITLMGAGDSTDIANWQELGWRDDTTDEDKEYAYGATATVPWGTNFYSVYSRSYEAHFYSGVNPTDKTKESSTAYYNTNTTSTPTKVSITLMTKEESVDVTGWDERGWRTDTTRTDRQHEYGETVTVDWGTNFYGAYQRNTTLEYRSHRD